MRAAPPVVSGSAADWPSASASTRAKVAISSAVLCKVTLRSGGVSQTFFARRPIELATDALAQS